ncbi:MAG: phenylacetate--CoA ligase family protein [Actinomycetota bacterium]
MSNNRTTGLGSPLEGLSDEERKAHHATILKDAVRIAWDGVPFYREQLERAGLTPGDISSLDDLPKIPITKKTEAKGLSVGTGTIPLQEARRIYVSPGPHVYASQRRSDPPPERGKTQLALAFHAMGFRENDIVLNTFSYHLTPGGFGIEDQLTAAGCAVIPAGPQSTEVQAQVLAEVPVTGYVGTPTFLKLLCDKSEEIGFKPRDTWKLEVAFVTAEKLTEETRAELEERTGARVRQIYGSADGLLASYECWAAQGMHLHPDQIFEVLDPETNEPSMLGSVVATVANKNRPLLRFANMDIVEMRDDPCPCGRTGPRIARFVGRLDDATKVRGMFVYAEQIDQVMNRFEVKRWQAIIDKGPSGDEFKVLVETEADVSNAIASALKDLVRVRADVERVSEGTIPSNAKRLDDRR